MQGKITQPDKRICVDQTIDGRAITIQGTGRLTTTIPNGISELTLTTRREFSGGSGDLTVFINGVSVGVIPYGENVQTTTISNINASGDVELEIRTPSNSDRVVMDNLTWTTNP